MKFFKGLFITAVVLGLLGFGGYFIFNKFIENKAVEYVEKDLATSNDIAAAREYVDNSPALKSYIAEGADADLSQLPFQTREEATRLVMQKLTLQEMQQIQAQAANGMTDEEALELIKSSNTS